MPFQQMNNYIVNNLANDVAAYLNPKVQNFPNVANYYGAAGYFNEGTVQGVIFMCLNQYIALNENPAHYLVRTEVTYGNGLNNRTDLMITYNDGNGPRNIALELKVDFDSDSVNSDIEVLDAARGLQNPPIENGYACYIVRNGQGGWTQYIDDPTQNDVDRVPILVN